LSFLKSGEPAKPLLVDEMKSILFIWKELYPWDVRVEKFCRAFRDTGFNVTILSRWNPGYPEREEIDGLQIIRVGFGKPASFSLPVSPNPIWYKYINSFVKENKPSLIISRDIMLAEAAGRIARKHNIPSIIDIAEHYPAVMKGWKKYRERKIYNLLVHQLGMPETFERRSIRHSDGIIVVCREHQQRMLQEFNYSADNIAIVHNTPEQSDFVNLRLGSRPIPQVYAYHGSVMSERNLSTFLKGFINAARVNTDIEFDIAGSGEELDDLKALASDAGMANRIHFYGKYNHSRMNEFYNRMDIGVLPYRLDDHIHNTISNKFFDYMAAGKPVIVSKAVPMLRLLEEYPAGMAIDCDSVDTITSTILKISDNDLKQMSENGINAVREKYNWETDKKLLLDFINKYVR
jgi:glycosyltransferase involved in cell wall biosynthesis